MTDTAKPEASKPEKTGKVLPIPSASLVLPEAGLQNYLREIQKYPLLAAEEEAMLARRWRDESDREAAHRLVTSHLRLVAKIAMGYRGYGLPVAEIISEGNIGLMQAVQRFDPEKGFRLTTYAVWWIRAAIQEYVLRSWSLVKTGTTAAQKKLFFNLRKARREIETIETMAEGEAPPRGEVNARIAKRLGVQESEVEMMTQRLSGSDLSLNAPMRAEGEGEWQDWIASEEPGQEEIVARQQEKDYRHAILVQALKGLNPREQDIITKRRLTEPPMTLEELSKFYDISRERIRQLEMRALEKLRKAVRKQVQPSALAAAKSAELR